MRGYLLWLAIGAAACGGDSLKRAGESCSASSECDTGLLCNFGAEPHTCENMGSLDAAEPTVDAPRTHIDAGHVDAKPIDARPIDARPIDAAVDAPPDAPP